MQKGEGYAQFRMNFRYRKLSTTYYTIKMRIITLNIMYLSSRTNPAGNTVHHSRNTQLTTWGSGQGVVSEITRTTAFLVLNFGPCAVFIYTNLSLGLQTNRKSITGPVESESGIALPQIKRRQFPRSLPHLKILGVNVIGLRTQLSLGT